MKAYVCVAVLALLGLSHAMNIHVNGIDEQEEKTNHHSSSNVLFFEPHKEERVQPKVKSVTCSDGSKCPDGNTCCEDAQGDFACCPLAEATCCEDKIHCCPKGYTCDLKAGTCSKGLFSLPLYTKLESKKRVEADEGLPCPGGRVSCPSQTTCCLLVTGGYGCCPLPQAVCCADGVHCCPNGYTCDVSAGTCNRAGETLSWFPKQPATPVPPKEPVRGVTCPDQSSCPDGSTCCDNGQGGYGCCPLPKAVCCSDKRHCCPSGYTCDLSSGRCNRGQEVIEWLTKQPSKPAPVKDVICPDESSCPDGSTCCADQQIGQYACCPLPKAVCCSDQLHCCPNGYTCDVSSGRCNMGNIALPWLSKLAATPAPRGPRSDYITCPDKSKCPDNNTCCLVGSNQYGCCPTPKAVCCSDHLHCCPEGYHCEVGAGACYKGNSAIPWLTKTAAEPAAEPAAVVLQ